MVTAWPGQASAGADPNRTAHGLHLSMSCFRSALFHGVAHDVCVCVFREKEGGLSASQQCCVRDTCYDADRTGLVLWRPLCCSLVVGSP